MLFLLSDATTETHDQKQQGIGVKLHITKNYNKVRNSLKITLVLLHKHASKNQEGGAKVTVRRRRLKLIKRDVVKTLLLRTKKVELKLLFAEEDSNLSREM